MLLSLNKVALIPITWRISVKGFFFVTLLSDMQCSTFHWLRATQPQSNCALVPTKSRTKPGQSLNFKCLWLHESYEFYLSFNWVIHICDQNVDHFHATPQWLPWTKIGSPHHRYPPSKMYDQKIWTSRRMQVMRVKTLFALFQCICPNNSAKPN